ncbi:MAG: cupin domain-containing protein, partial [Alphaproteobacteria bacterium]
HYAEDELCVLLSGRVVLTDAQGAQRTFVAGDAFVVPAGFLGTWEVVETARKIYAIHEMSAA